jgi:hypothetical protein
MNIYDLPTEVLHIIADFGVFWPLVAAFPPYARAVDVSCRYDRMIACGHNISITRDLIEWTKYGYAHRMDGPAHEHADGERCWYKWGVLHRLDGPAKIYSDGREDWYRYGMYHRDTDPPGPAVQRSYFQSWYVRGCLHREDGPAHIYGRDLCWYRWGVKHRDGGPAERDGDTIRWWQWGKLHRDDGPAVVHAGSGTPPEWWRYGVKIERPGDSAGGDASRG